ncbi:NAD(P)/FAD-dependent oxidoreductase [Nocardioides taihuensis]|uniref:NAD(P)/FAD-dependent oxidoreductase n=1 Tax=Nocardioides taihuensis TaxID=1835606 RepID=A0ABW0BEA3_9ACTN
MSATPRGGVLIVGAGAAGATAATELRALGYDGPLTVVNGETHAPYNRTTVNKGLLQGDMTLDSVALAVPSDPGTTWVLGSRAVGLDTAGRRVRLDSGASLGYGSLLVATGAHPRRIPAPHPPGVASRVRVLRTAEDALGLRALLAEAAGRGGADSPVRVAVVGGGLLGAETADALASGGAEVVLVDPDPAPLGRVLGPTVGGWLRQRHEQHLRTAFGVTVTGLGRAGADVVVSLSDGRAVAVDLVLAAVGVEPSVGWLAGSPVAVGDGVHADGRLRALGAVGVYVAGDLANVETPAGARRIEHWGHALAQGRHAARVIAHDLGLAEDPGPFEPSLSFATRLHGKAMTVVGTWHPSLREVVLAGDVADDAVTVGFADADDRLVGAVALGSPKVVNRVRSVVAGRGPLGAAREAVAAVAAPRA